MSRFKFPDGQTVRVGQAYSRDGVNYPADWLGALTEQERLALGLEIVPEPPAHDPRFASVTETAPGVYETTPVPIAQAKAARVTEVKALRWQKEVAGLVYLGVKVATDEISQAKLGNTVLLSQYAPEPFAIQWSGIDGTLTLDKPQLIAMGVAVGTQVQALFAVQRAKIEAIEALTTVAGVVAYDVTAGWPA
ncbi:MAG: DUF4376 domain-containing protein [Tagaea sp.]|nr:DUF4376 domain-containing protein [Tagaea sp.]